MITEPLDKYFGIPLSQWIERTPNELDVDAVGLWQIVPEGRDSFGLEGKALRDFVKRSVMALVERGAVPVLPSPDKNEDWVRQDQYGVSPSAVASGVITEWQASGVDPTVDGLWFALDADIRPE